MKAFVCLRSLISLDIRSILISFFYSFDIGSKSLFALDSHFVMMRGV